jgi:hypothetical protein
VWNEVIEIAKLFLITSVNAIYNLEILAGHNTGEDLIYMPKSDVYNTKYLNCFNQAVKWDDSSREQYHSILKQADSMEYVSREYYDGSMLDRNHHLVEVAGVLLVVYNDEQRLR